MIKNCSPKGLVVDMSTSKQDLHEAEKFNEFKLSD
jgi:hypothetical protein